MTVETGQPTGLCDPCGNEFQPGQWWNYHSRLRVYVHAHCAATRLVRGEDINTHTMLVGRVPIPAAGIQTELVQQLGRLYMDFTHPATAERLQFVQYREHAKANATAIVDLLLPDHRAAVLDPVTDLFEKWAAEEQEHRRAGELGLAEGLHAAIEDLRTAIHGRKP